MGHTTIQQLLSEASNSLHDNPLKGQATAVRDINGIRFAVTAKPKTGKLTPRYTYAIDGKRVSFTFFADALSSVGRSS